VIVIDKIEDALTLAGALFEGGIKVLEITVIAAVVLTAIEIIAREFPDAVVGAGTIKNVQNLKNARDAGSQFCVSPV
jgi:2-dehydro-3-deoxyphosphogluconate aldolase/(4S)-4-hydroxy-2-oxoglutarate aldolase